MIVLIDTREKKPWKFPVHIHTEKVGMADGDYCVKGYEQHIRIERKSLNDLTNCLMDSQLQRYCGQLQRLRKYPHRAVIVEANMSQIEKGYYRCGLPPDKVLERLLDTLLRFKVPCILAGNAESSARMALQFMVSAVKQVELG